MVAADITIDNLMVTARSQQHIRGRLIDGVSLSIPASSVCAVVGKSGSGKTTLLKSIANILDPDAVEWTSGVQIRRANMPEATPSVGVVFQHSFLFPWHTALQNVGLHDRVRHTDDTERAAKALEMLTRVGLADHGHKYPHELSGGMQQRVALAREFARQLDVLLLDEPFRLLDPVTQEELVDCLIKTWQASFKPTVLIITHDAGEAVQLADRVVVMGGGQIVQTIEISSEFSEARGRERRASRHFQELVECVLDHLRRAP